MENYLLNFIGLNSTTLVFFKVDLKGFSHSFTELFLDYAQQYK